MAIPLRSVLGDEANSPARRLDRARSRRLPPCRHGAPQSAKHVISRTPVSLSSRPSRTVHPLPACPPIPHRAPIASGEPIREHHHHAEALTFDTRDALRSVLLSGSIPPTTSSLHRQRTPASMGGPAEICALATMYARLTMVPSVDTADRVGSAMRSQQNETAPARTS